MKRPDQALRGAIVVTSAAVVAAAALLLWASLGDDDGTVETQPGPTPPIEEPKAPSGAAEGQPYKRPSSAVVIVEGDESAANTTSDTRGRSSGGSTTTSPTSPTSTTEAPRRPVQRPAIDGDIDGDGRVDQVTLVPAVDTVRVVAWLTTLGTREVTVTASAPKLIGVVDMNGDGFGEIVLRTDRQADAQDQRPRQGEAADGVLGTAITLVDDELAEVTTNDQPWRFEVSSTSGLECRDVDRSAGVEIITTRTEDSPSSTTTSSPKPPTLVERVHQLAGAALQQLGGPATREGAPQVACGSLPPADDWAAD